MSVDLRFYLQCLAKSAARTDCAIHAYVLMTNHVHLLATPGAPGSAAAMLQDIGRRYVRVINTIHGRTGTPWSSHAHYAAGKSNNLITEHAAFSWLGCNSGRAASGVPRPIPG